MNLTNMWRIPPRHADANSGNDYLATAEAGVASGVSAPLRKPSERAWSALIGVHKLLGFRVRVA
jgi:hypothetical protein